MSMNKEIDARHVGQRIRVEIELDPATGEWCVFARLETADEDDCHAVGGHDDYTRCLAMAWSYELHADAEIVNRDQL